MSGKQYVKGILAILLAIIVYDNLPSLPFYSHQISSRHVGSNSDITNGALSQLHAITYVVQYKNGDQQTFGSGEDTVICKQRGTFYFGVLSYVPFYKKMEPHLVFDCHIAATNKYIGKIEILKQVTMSGLFNRGLMKQILQNDYTNEALQLLSYKSLSYEKATGLAPAIKQRHTGSSSFVSASSGCDPTSCRLKVTLADWVLTFSRTIPIRQQEQVYSDTIFFKPNVSDPEYPLYEIYKVNKPARLITYTSYNSSKNVIYSKKFTMEKADENDNKFYYGAYVAYNHSD